MRLRTLLLAALALPALVALPACGDDAADPGTTTDGGGATTTTAPAGETTPVTVYFAQDEYLHAVAADVVVEGDAVLRPTLEALLAGPTGPGSEAGDTTEIPEGTELNDVTVEDGTATIDLSTEFESGGGSASMLMRVAQVTFTATQFPTVDDVRYRIDGSDVSAIGGEGVVVEPSNRADFEAVLPAIFVDTPPDGATVGQEFGIEGTSNTFEATHQIELLGADGDPFLQDHVTATSGNGTRGAWVYTGRIPVGVTGAITLRVYEVSAEDGSEVNVVTEALEVAAEDAAGE